MIRLPGFPAWQRLFHPQNPRCPDRGNLRPSRSGSDKTAAVDPSLYRKGMSQMRTVILLGLVVGGLLVAGAIHITQSGDHIEISVDKQKVEAVAGEAIREGEAILRNAAAQGGSQTK
ncbi:MAG: hypothetical protein EBR23_09295 [Planctomycetia bacterium]|jgi:hypothetical protein|nr:hypothetical protein [Planctomycetia bacterium]